MLVSQILEMEKCFNFGRAGLIRADFSHIYSDRTKVLATETDLLTCLIQSLNSAGDHFVLSAPNLKQWYWRHSKRQIIDSETIMTAL